MKGRTTATQLFKMMLLLKRICNEKICCDWAQDTAGKCNSLRVLLHK